MSFRLILQVETYVPWNLHEPKKNEFDFGQDQSKNDMSIFLDIRKFIQLAQAEDLLLILRPGRESILYFFLYAII